MDGDPTDGDKLLPGEAAAVASGRRQDAKHWVDVYRELFDFKSALMHELNQQRGRVDPDGQSEVRNDESIFQREAARLERRLRFWESVLTRLEG